MHPLRLLFAFVVFVFLGGALLAPGAHALVAWIGQYSERFNALAHSPFHRYVSRSVLLLALLCLWPLCARLGVRSWRDLGYAAFTPHWPQMLAGFLLGLGSLALTVMMGMWAGVWQIQPGYPAPALARWLLTTTLAAGVVGIMEETVFRGALFGSLRKSMPLPWAVLASSVFFAMLHLFQKAAVPGKVEWYSGLAVLAQIIEGLGDWRFLVPGLINITLVGICLAVAFQRSGNLYFSMGLHAGWIFWLKTFRRFFQSAGQPHDPWFWGSQNLIDGWMALLMLLLTFLVVWRWPMKSVKGPG